MTPIYLMNLAAQHAGWASARQAAITGNIANVNTSGYTAMEVAPFSSALEAMESGEDSFAVAESGLPVSLDGELVKANETSRSFALDTTIMRAFHQMLQLSVRSGA